MVPRIDPNKSAILVEMKSSNLASMYAKINIDLKGAMTT